MSLSKAAFYHEFQQFLTLNKEYVEALKEMGYSEISEVDLMVFANEFIHTLDYPKLKLWDSNNMMIIDITNSHLVTATHMDEIITKLKKIIERHKHSNKLIFLLGVTKNPSNFIRVKLYLER